MSSIQYNSIILIRMEHTVCFYGTDVVLVCNAFISAVLLLLCYECQTVPLFSWDCDLMYH